MPRAKKNQVSKPYKDRAPGTQHRGAGKNNKGPISDRDLFKEGGGENSLISSLVRSRMIILELLFLYPFNDFTVVKILYVCFYPVIRKLAYSFFQWTILMIIIFCVVVAIMESHDFF